MIIARNVGVSVMSSPLNKTVVPPWSQFHKKSFNTFHTSVHSQLINISDKSQGISLTVDWWVVGWTALSYSNKKKKSFSL